MSEGYDSDGNALRQGFYEIIGKNEVIYYIGKTACDSWGFNVGPSSFRHRDLKPIDPKKRIGKLEKEIEWIKLRMPVTVPETKDIAAT